MRSGSVNVGGRMVPPSEAGTADAKEADRIFNSRQNNSGGLDNYTSYNPAPVYQPKPKAPSKKRPVRSKPAPTSSKADDDFSPIFAVIAFIATSIAVYQPNEENGVASLILGGIAGVLAGKLYKVILVLGFVVILLFVFSHVPN